MKSPSCRKYDRRLNDEVAVGEFYHDHLLKSALQRDVITVEGKRAFRIPEHVPITMYDVTQKGLNVLPKMRFVYLSSLVEAFVKEYICERSVTANSTFEDVIKSIKSVYSKTKKSTSLYNIEYVADLLSHLYQIDLRKMNISNVFRELGPLRQCIIHDEGVISNQTYMTSLANTLAFCGIQQQVGVAIDISKKLMAELIENFRCLIKACDYN